MTKPRSRPTPTPDPSLPEPLISPHRYAPAFDGPGGPRVLKDLIKRFQSGEVYGKDLSLEDPLRLLIAQAGFVNLWFFLKYIVGYSISPFDLLDSDTHVDMCEFRQKFLEPGGRAAAFLPREAYKTTIFTEGGAAWELLRDPALTVLISTAKADKAQEFFATVKMTFESNPFLRFLYGNPGDPWGSYVPENPKNAPRWNDTEIVMPNRPRWQREASLTYGGVGGASEGGHFDLHIVDDMIGLKGLNATQEANAVMTKTRNWFWSSEKTLLRTMASSRVFVVGTRYAVDDVYDDIIKRSKRNEGFPLSNFEAPANGTWVIYYRKAVENGKIILPQVYTEEGLRELAEHDWWTYVTQYLNDPQASGLAELVDFPLKKCKLEWVAVSKQWFILLENGEEMREISLSECDVVVAVDPAATERRISAKTSRTAVTVIATHSSRRRFLIDLRCGFVSPLVMFNWIFALKERFSPRVRATLLESNAGFKVLAPILREEERKKGVFLHLAPFAAAGDKVARIRSTLLPELEAGRLYIASVHFDAVEEEKRGFPQAVHKMDILDALSTGIAGCIVPADEEEVNASHEADEAFSYRTSNVAGY